VKYRNGLGKGQDGYYHFCVKFRGEVRKGNTWCKSRAVAEAWLKKETDKWAEEAFDLPREAPTLRKTLEAWKTAMKGSVTDRHLDDVENHMLLHCEPILDLRLDQIRNPQVDPLRVAFLEGMRTGNGWKTERPRTKGGWNTVQKYLKLLFRWALVKQRWVSQIQWTHEKLKSQKTRKAVVWPEQTQAFLAGVDAQPSRSKDNHPGIAVRLMLGLGIREDEALTARWEWIDWRNQLYIPGKTKNRNTRVIDIPGWLRDFLEAYHERKDKPNEGLLLHILTTGQPHAQEFTHDAITSGGVAIKTRGLTPHAMRRSFATAHWENGTDMSQLQQMLGHDDPTTTMKYIEMRPKGQADAQEKVAQAQGFNKKKVPPQLPDEEVIVLNAV